MDPGLSSFRSTMDARLCPPSLDRSARTTGWVFIETVRMASSPHRTVEQDRGKAPTDELHTGFTGPPHRYQEQVAGTLDLCSPRQWQRPTAFAAAADVRDTYCLTAAPEAP